MDGLARTPTILLEITQLSDISTLLNLRLAKRAIWWLISTYEASISIAIAEHSFPIHLRRLQPPHHRGPTVKWLLELRRREIIARRLSAVSVENGFGWVYCGVCGQDDFGDPLRKRVENGWYILWHLSDIAETVESSERDVEPRQFLGLRPRQITLVRKFEAIILSQRLEFLQQLTPHDVEDYNLMHFFMGGSFQRSWLCDLGYDIGMGHRAVGRKDSWLNWFLLRLGPRFFDGLWTETPGRAEVVDYIEKEWKARSKKRIRIERDAGIAVNWEMRRGKKHYMHSHLDWLRDFYKEHNKQLLRRDEMGLPHKGLLYPGFRFFLD
ncbi:MAG: hypothetical protein M1830_003252 [Pleopsidium flavum]|nr:MAG: hypothetical protein M1830_003252 [Pleopsidium flavum]